MAEELGTPLYRDLVTTPVREEGGLRALPEGPGVRIGEAAKPGPGAKARKPAKTATSCRPSCSGAQKEDATAVKRALQVLNDWFEGDTSTKGARKREVPERLEGVAGPPQQLIDGSLGKTCHPTHDRKLTGYCVTGLSQCGEREERFFDLLTYGSWANAHEAAARYQQIALRRRREAEATSPQNGKCENAPTCKARRITSAPSS